MSLACFITHTQESSQDRLADQRVSAGECLTTYTCTAVRAFQALRLVRCMLCSFSFETCASTRRRFIKWAEGVEHLLTLVIWLVDVFRDRAWKLELFFAFFCLSHDLIDNIDWSAKRSVHKRILAGFGDRSDVETFVLRWLLRIFPQDKDGNTWSLSASYDQYAGSLAFHTS